MKFPRVQSEIVRQWKVPVESLKSPIWSTHFHGLVPGCTITFHAHLAFSNWPNGRIRQRPRNHGASLSTRHRWTKIAEATASQSSRKDDLGVLAAKLKKQTKRPASQFWQLIRLIQPETVFRWHRDLVRRKWTQENKGKRGRPRIDEQKEHLIVRLAKENLRWGYYRIEGELKKLGFDRIVQK